MFKKAINPTLKRYGDKHESISFDCICQTGLINVDYYCDPCLPDDAPDKEVFWVDFNKPCGDRSAWWDRVKLAFHLFFDTLRGRRERCFLVASKEDMLLLVDFVTEHCRKTDAV